MHQCIIIKNASPMMSSVHHLKFFSRLYLQQGINALSKSLQMPQYIHVWCTGRSWNIKLLNMENFSLKIKCLQTIKRTWACIIQCIASPQGVGKSVRKWMLSHSLVQEMVTSLNPTKGRSTHRVGGPMFANKKNKISSMGDLMKKK